MNRFFLLYIALLALCAGNINAQNSASTPAPTASSVNAKVDSLVKRTVRLTTIVVAQGKIIKAQRAFEDSVRKGLIAVPTAPYGTIAASPVAPAKSGAVFSAAQIKYLRDNFMNMPGSLPGVDLVVDGLIANDAAQAILQLGRGHEDTKEWRELYDAAVVIQKAQIAKIQAKRAEEARKKAIATLTGK